MRTSTEQTQSQFGAVYKCGLHPPSSSFLSSSFFSHGNQPPPSEDFCVFLIRAGRKQK